MGKSSNTINISTGDSGLEGCMGNKRDCDFEGCALGVVVWRVVWGALVVCDLVGYVGSIEGFGLDGSAGSIGGCNLAGCVGSIGGCGNSA